MNLAETKIISMGGGCFSNILLVKLNHLTGLSIRVPGPIDNLRSVYGIDGSLHLFDKSLEQELLSENAEYREIKKAKGKQSYDEVDIEFAFKNFVIVHNDYRTEKYKKGLKQRFENFYDFYEKSLNNDNYLYIYTLCQYDRKSLGHLYNIKHKLEKLGILDKILFIGTAVAPVPLEGQKISNMGKWPDYNWPEWQEVFGDRYIVLRNCDYYDTATKLFLEKLQKL